METYLTIVARFPRLILLSLTLITVYLGYMSGYLTEDSNPYLLPESHPARASILEMREDFTGTYDSVLIALHNEDSVYNPATLAALFEFTQSAKTIMLATEADEQRLAQIAATYPDNQGLQQGITELLAQGLSQSDAALAEHLVKQSQQWQLSRLDQKYFRVLAERLDPIEEIAGMAGTENVFLERDGTLRAAITLNQADIAPDFIADAMIGNELMQMGVVDPSGKTALVVIEISILQDDAEGQLRAYNVVNQFIEDYQQAHPELTDQIFVGGVPVFFAEQKLILDADMATLFPAVLLLVALVLAVFFKSVLGVVIPLVNVIMCTVWTLGMMAIVGIPLDLITSVLPVFLITICSSDAIHVMADYYHQKRNSSSNLEAWKTTMRLMASPIALTTIATCVTFTVSTMTSISNLRNFGICMAFGMFVAMIISLLLIPAWLSLLSDKKVKQLQGKPAQDYLISKLLLKALKPVMAKRRQFLIGFTALLIGLGAIGSQVRIDDMGSGYFDADNRFRVADEFINARIAGTSPGWIEIDTGEVDGVFEPKLVEFIDKLEKFIHEDAQVTYSYSLPRYIRRINYVLNDLDPAYDRLPAEIERFVEIDEETGEQYTVEVAGRDIIRQAILMYENGGGSDLTNVVTEDFSKTALLYTMNTTVASDFQRFLDRLEPWLAQNLPQGMSYKLAGSPVIWTAVLDELLSGQMLSIFLAFACVIAVMGAWLKSFKMGLVGTLPLAVTVVFYYAVMTIFDIELNIGTAIISFLVLGVVDYSVHYLLRTKHGLQQGLTLDEALEAAIVNSGRSIIANVFVFTIGFVALLFSEFRPIIDLGSLVGLSLLISGIMSLFVITLLAPWLIPTDNQAQEVAEDEESEESKEGQIASA